MMRCNRPQLHIASVPELQKSEGKSRVGFEFSILRPQEFCEKYGAAQAKNLRANNSLANPY
jgi:hypothetical protein